MKKLISMLLVLMMVLSCASALADLTTDGYDGSAVTINFYHIINKDNQLEVLNNAIAEFNKEYPNITVNAENAGSYNDILKRISEEINGGNQRYDGCSPPIALLDPNCLFSVKAEVNLSMNVLV